MPKGFTRSDRLAQQIQRDLAELIRSDLNHPKAILLTLTGVEVTRDYSHAKVFFTFMGEKEDLPALTKMLEEAAGYLRSQLSRGIKLFKMPELHFHYDHSIETGMRIDQLIADAAGSRAKEDE